MLIQQSVWLNGEMTVQKHILFVLIRKYCMRRVHYCNYCVTISMTILLLKVSILPVEAVSTPQLSIAKGILRQDNASRSGNKRVAFVSSGSDHSDTVFIFVYKYPHKMDKL